MESMPFCFYWVTLYIRNEKGSMLTIERETPLWYFVRFVMSCQSSNMYLMRLLSTCMYHYLCGAHPLGSTLNNDWWIRSFTDVWVIFTARPRPVISIPWCTFCTITIFSVQNAAFSSIYHLDKVLKFCAIHSRSHFEVSLLMYSTHCQNLYKKRIIISKQNIYPHITNSL